MKRTSEQYDEIPKKNWFRTAVNVMVTTLTAGCGSGGNPVENPKDLGVPATRGDIRYENGRERDTENRIEETKTTDGIVDSKIGAGTETLNPDISQPTVSQYQIQTTDSTGKALFQIGGKEYILNAYDNEKNEPVGGLLVKLSLSGETGIFIILDPQDRYYPTVTGINNQVGSFEIAPDGKADSAFETTVSNVLLNKKEHACKIFPSYYTITGSDIDELYAQKKDKKGILQNNFYQPEGTKTVKLSELNDKLKMVIEGALSDAAKGGIGEGVAKITILFGTTIQKTVNAAGEATGFALAVMDFCAYQEQIDWARYYLGLCYSNDDEFEVWKAKDWPEVGVNIEGIDIAVVTNPVFLVLPKEKKYEWAPPTAIINGTVNSDALVSNILWPFVILENEKLPLAWSQLWYDTPLGKSYIPTSGLDAKKGHFSFIAGACESFDSAYELGISTLLPTLKPKVSLSVKKDSVYKVDFYLDPMCTKGYSEYYQDKDADGLGNDENIAVSCSAVSGYVQNKKDCDDNDPSKSGGVCPNTCTSISVEAYNGLSKSIYGDIIAFTNDPGEAPSSVYYIDIKDGNATLVPKEDKYTSGGSTSVWKDKIVFRCSIGNSQAGICLYNVENADLTVIDTQESSSSLSDPTIYEDIVAYAVNYKNPDIDFKLKYWHIRIFDVSSGTYEDADPVGIYPIEKNTGYPFPKGGSIGMFGTKIILGAVTSTYSLGTVDLFSYDYISKEWLNFTNETKGKNNGYDIYGNHVVFCKEQGPTSNLNDIKSYDFDSGTLEVLATEVLSAGVSVWGDKVVFGVWEDNGLYIIDLKTGEIKKGTELLDELPYISAGNWLVAQPRIWENRVVFFDYDTGPGSNQTLYWCTLKDEPKEQ